MLDLVEHIRWDKDLLVILDQTLLPAQTKFLRLKTIEQVWEAIKVLRVRGAPAIGVAAGYGLCLGLQGVKTKKSAELIAKAKKMAAYLDSSRPTAVNLHYAVNRIVRQLQAHASDSAEALQALALREAHLIFQEDLDACRAIGLHGAPLLRKNCTVLTHCNAGGLATSRWGTALAPVYVAHEQGKKVSVFADETRPLLQGSRLTAYELNRAGVPVTVICDNMAAMVMAQEKIDLVIVGADRIAANGDFANKIGTYGLAIIAKEHNVPFYCAAPLSTIDMKILSGNKIPIEERSGKEISHGFGKQTAPKGVPVFNPAFDVTPHQLVTAFITEKGIIKPPFATGLKSLFSRP